MLENLCSHTMSFGVYSFETEDTTDWHRAFAQIDGARTRVANFKGADSEARELRADLQAALKKPVRTVIVGTVYQIDVRPVGGQAFDSFQVSIEVAPKLDPNVKPFFTAKQGQCLAYIALYTKVHRCPPAESDLQRYFRVSGPSIHEMIRTLERNGLLEKTPRVARSIRLLVAPEHLPPLK